MNRNDSVWQIAGILVIILIFALIMGWVNV